MASPMNEESFQSPSSVSSSDDSAVDDEDRQIKTRWRQRAASRMSVQKKRSNVTGRRVFSVDDSMLNASVEKIDDSGVRHNRDNVKSKRADKRTDKKTAVKESVINIIIGETSESSNQPSSVAGQSKQNGATDINPFPSVKTPVKTYSFEHSPKRQRVPNRSVHLSKRRRSMLEDTLTSGCHGNRTNSKRDQAVKRRQVTSGALSARVEHIAGGAQNSPLQDTATDLDQMDVSVDLWQGQNGDLGRKKKDVQDLDIILQRIEEATLEYRNSLDKGPLRKAVNMFGRGIQSEFQAQIELRHKVHKLESSYKKSVSAVKGKRRELSDLLQQLNSQQVKLDELTKTHEQLKQQQQVQVIHSFLHLFEEVEDIFLDNTAVLVKTLEVTPSVKVQLSENSHTLKELLKDWQ